MSVLLKKSTETATADSASNPAHFSPSSPLEFRAPKAELKRALAAITRIADSKSSLKILGNVAIRATQAGVSLVATDLNNYVSVRASWPRPSPGGITVNAKALSGLVKKLPDGDITIRVTSRGGLSYAVVSAGSVNASLEGIPDRDFPQVPKDTELSWSTVDAKSFGQLFARTGFSICKDETRFHLNGTLLERNGFTVRTVTTDGHRLTKAEGTLHGSQLDIPYGVIVGAKGSAEIAKLLGKARGSCDVALSKPYLFVRYEGTTLALKLIDAQFPPYEQVIPKEYKVTVSADRETLIGALERAKVSCLDTHGVKLGFYGDSMVITTDNPDLGTTTETIPVDNANGANLAIGFAPKYLIELLEQIEGNRVLISLNDELAPGLFRSAEPTSGASFLGVVMPMRI